MRVAGERSRKPSASAGVSSRCAWCCPCTSTNDAPSSASVDAVASCPPTARRSSRPRRSSVRGSPHRPPPSRRRRSVASNRAWTRAACAPSRTSERRPRAPNASARPTVTMVLPAPGLSREDVQARMQVEIEVVDDPEAADVQLPQHARSLSGAADIRRRPSSARIDPGSSNLSLTRERNGGASASPHQAGGPLRRADPRRGSRPAARSLSRPSAESRPGSSPTTSSTTCCCAPSTKDRSNTMCAAIGVSTRHGTSGLTIGPRAENEYAVEPVGVATTTPSAENVVTYSPSTSTASRTRRCRRPLLDHDLVQRPLGSELGTAVRGLRGHGEPLLDRGPGPPARSRMSSSASGRLHLRQEAEPSHLHTQDGTVQLRRDAGGPKERAVPADRDDQVGARRAVVRPALAPPSRPRRPAPRRALRPPRPRRLAPRAR